MTLLEHLNSIHLLLTVVSLTLLYVGQCLISVRKWPSAPGPKIAAYTSLWYLWKVSRGKFETWNIEQHKQKGEWQIVQQAYTSDVINHLRSLNKSPANLNSHDLIPFNLGKILQVAPGMYSISDPVAIQEIYAISSSMPKSAWYEAFGDPRVPNHNLFSALDSTVHAGMRRKCASLYSMTTISNYEPSVNNCTRLLLAQFDRLAESKRKLDLQRWMQAYAFDVIGEITFGSRIGFLESGGQDIGDIMVGLEKSNSFSTFMGIQKLGAPLYFLRYGNPIRALNDWVQRATEARADITRDEKTQMACDEPVDFYSKLQVARTKDPEGYKRHKMEVVLTGNIAAGSDTTSIALTATLFHLATSASASRRLRSEILETEQKGESLGTITFEQSQKMPYLQAVIKEALRLWPATGLPMWRVVQKQGATIAGTYFPPDATVGMNSWVLHRNAQVFAPDPEAFRPERWLECGGEQLKNMERCYMPFGLGTRTCIGKNVSILEMSKVIPELVRRYNFQVLESEMQYTNHWFVKPRDVFVTVVRA